MAGLFEKRIIKITPIVIIFFAFLFSKPVFSENITTGDASAKSSITNEVNGGDVYTKIELRANGEKKVLETTESGTHKLEVKSNSNASAEATSFSENNDESTEGAGFDEKAKSGPQVVVQKIFDVISELFKKILSLFG